jgi:hypothetical protein
MQKEACFEDEREAEKPDQILKQTQDKHNAAAQKHVHDAFENIVQDTRDSAAESDEITHDGHDDESNDSDSKISEDEKEFQIDVAVPLDASKANKYLACQLMLMHFEL